MFAFGHKSPTDLGRRHVSEWHLSTEHSLLMQVQRGDALRAERGTVWIRLDEQPTGLELRAGEVHTVPCDGVLCLIGADMPRITVSSHRPVTSRTLADYGGWRYRPLARPPRSKLRRLRLLDRWLQRPVRTTSIQTHA